MEVEQILVTLLHDISDPRFRNTEIRGIDVTPLAEIRGLRSQVESLHHTSTGWVRWMFTWRVRWTNPSLAARYLFNILHLLLCCRDRLNFRAGAPSTSVFTEMARFFRKTSSRYLRSKRVAHRDLKPENLLLTSEGVLYAMRPKLGSLTRGLRIPMLQWQCDRTGRLKLVDFDAAMYVPEAWASVTFGVRHYSNKQKERHMIWEVRYTVYSEGFLHGSHHHLILAGWGWCSCWTARKCRPKSRKHVAEGACWVIGGHVSTSATLAKPWRLLGS